MSPNLSDTTAVIELLEQPGQSVEHLATINLIAGIGLKIVCILVGFGVVYLGYKLLLAGVKGKFKFSASWLKNKADLASASPGLLFLLLGCFLIGYTLSAERKIPVNFDLDYNIKKSTQGDKKHEKPIPPIPPEKPIPPIPPL